jgi:glycosyltransferase involved in cell wall biosynthesis
MEQHVTEIKEHPGLTIHMMVRNEFPTVVFALLSALPGAAKAIVVDTGSTDGTRDYLLRIQKMHPEKVELHFRDNIPDSCGWSFQRYNPPNRELTLIRQWMVRQTKTEYFWIVDGDEVYRDVTVRQIVEYLDHWPEGKSVIYIPLLWFSRDIHTLGCFQPSSYSITGRLFRKDGIHLFGTFPGEVHRYQDEDLGPHSPRAVIAHGCEPFHHYEMTMKPYRRKTIGTVPYDGPQPEVFTRFGRNGRKSLGKS